MQLSMQNNGSNYKTCAEGYRFGFNGKEKDNETYGGGNAYDFGARIYDARLGRFLTIDPIAKQFPSESNFSYAGNSPITLVDVEGKKKILYILMINNDGSQTSLKVVDNSIVKTKTIETRESIGVAGVNLYTATVTNTETYDVYQFVTLNQQTGKIVYGEEKEGKKRTNNPITRAYEDNFIDKEKKGNYDGIAWISEVGRGEETKKGNGNRVETIDELQGILNLTKSAASGAEALLKPIEKITDFVKKIGDSQTFVEAANSVAKKFNKSAEPVDSVICNSAACNGKTVSVKDTATGHSGPYEPVKK